MKIKTLKAIRNLLRSRKSSLPVLDYFLIDKEYLTFTNLETHIKLKHQFPFKPILNLLLSGLIILSSGLKGLRHRISLPGMLT